MIKTKIFVVEDERIVSLALQRVLNKLVHTVVGSSSMPFRSKAMISGPLAV